VTVASTDFDIDLQLLRTAVHGIEQALTDENDDKQGAIFKHSVIMK